MFKLHIFPAYQCDMNHLHSTLIIAVVHKKKSLIFTGSFDKQNIPF